MTERGGVLLRRVRVGVKFDQRHDRALAGCDEGGVFVQVVDRARRIEYDGAVRIFGRIGEQLGGFFFGFLDRLAGGDDAWNVGNDTL
jgi:hypothetical protein